MSRYHQTFNHIGCKKKRKKKKREAVKKINDGRGLETFWTKARRTKGFMGQVCTQYGTMGQRDPEGFEAASSAVGLLRYIVCNLIISVVNNPVNKPRENKTEIRVGSETVRWNEKERCNVDAEMESSVISIVSVSRAVYLFSSEKDNKLFLFQKMNHFFIIYDGRGRIIFEILINKNYHSLFHG